MCRPSCTLDRQRFGLRMIGRLPAPSAHLCNLSLQLVFVTLSWSSTITLYFLELVKEDCFGYACVFHPCDVASPAQLHLKQDGLYAGKAGSLEDFFVRHVVLPFDAKNGAQAELVKLLQ